MVASALIALSANGAEETKNFRYGISGYNVSFTTLKEARAGSSFRLAVKDGQLASIKVELVDIYADASGAKRPIPLGSSPFSPVGLVKHKKKFSVYKPSAEYQYFDIAFRFKKGVKIDRPVLGGLKISLAAKNQTQNEVKIESSIVATFAYLPKGKQLAANYLPGLSLANPELFLAKPDGSVFGLIPDLPAIFDWPRVFSSGELVASSELTNTGQIFLETTTQLRLKPFVLGKPQHTDTLFEHQFEQAFLVPNQSAQLKTILDLAKMNNELAGATAKDSNEQQTRESTQTPQPQKNQQSQQVEVPPDRALGIGIYQVELLATGKLGQEISTQSTASRIFIVFPWKQLAVLLVVLLLLRKRITRWLRGLATYWKSFREFRKSAQASEPN